MVEYTYSNIIIDPTKKGIDSLIGKEVYFHNNPSLCLENANEKSTSNLGILVEISKNSIVPFRIEQKCGICAHTCAHACIIVKKEEPYAERAKKWIKENDLKKGDYVKVVRKAKDYEDGWDGRWTKERDDFIGKVIPVSDIGESTGVILSYCCCDWAGYDFPYFVLEKVEPEPKYVPFESKEEFIDAFHYHDNANYSETEDILLNYGMWLRCKGNGGLFQVVGFLNDAVYLNLRAFDTNYQGMLNDFEFLDGTPCGKESKDV